MKDLVILGAGGFGRETAWLVEEINRVMPVWNLLGFIDNNAELQGKDINGLSVLGSDAWLASRRDVYAVCGFSDPLGKKNIVCRLQDLGVRFATLIHPDARIAPTAAIGEGVIIQTGCVVSTNTVIGDHASLNPQCGIGHDAVIGAYSSLYWNVSLSGFVRLGEGCVLGSKSTVIQGLSLGTDVILGAGAVVIENIPSGSTAVGVPARITANR